MFSHQNSDKKAAHHTMVHVYNPVTNGWKHMDPQGLTASQPSKIINSMFQEPRGVAEEDSHSCTLGSTCIHTPVRLHTVTSARNTSHLYMPVFCK